MVKRKNLVAGIVVGVAVVFAVMATSVFSYVAGVQAGVMRETALVELHEAVRTHNPAAISVAAPPILKKVANDRDALLWLIAVTNDPATAVEHRAAVAAYCKAEQSLIAYLAHRIFAIGTPNCVGA